MHLSLACILSYNSKLLKGLWCTSCTGSFCVKGVECSKTCETAQLDVTFSFSSEKTVHGNSVGGEFVSETPHEAWNVIMPFIMVLELPVFLMEVSDALMQCGNSPFSPQKPKNRHISLSWFSWNCAKNGNTCVWQTWTMVLVIFSEQSCHMHNIHTRTSF